MRIDEALVRVDMGKRLTGSIQHLEAARYLLDLPGWWKKA